MDVTAKADPVQCICDDCYNDGCKSHLRIMRVVTGCSEFVNSKGEKVSDIIYSTSTKGFDVW